MRALIAASLIIAIITLGGYAWFLGKTYCYLPVDNPDPATEPCVPK